MLTPPIIHAFILGVLQGLTEFLPISSSGHLVLVPWLLGWDSPGLTFDVAVHWGTTAAVLIYFWRDWRTMLAGAWQALRERRLEGNEPARLLLLVFLAAVPSGIVGLLFHASIEALVRSLVWASAAFLPLSAALLFLCERRGRLERGAADITWMDALVVGAAQALALLPGVSRSGSTIAAGLTRGLRRETAARFSFLLATPTIIGAGLLSGLDWLQEGSAGNPPALGVGFLAAALVGYGCLRWLLHYLQARSLYPFALYCALLGGGVLLWGWLR